ncbi:hypothetical protein ACFV5N_00990 [Streptomyces sp. NPDC059853]|uniref:hypothetical protein n=1 Tax=Streptomyces sp. NPDC059853 TaxID=3346973 RepID=UPI0036584F13
MTDRPEMTRRAGVPARRVGELLELPVLLLAGPDGEKTADGEETVEAVLLLTPAGAEVLHTQLCRLLDGHTAPADAPVCRYRTPAEALAVAMRRGIR